MGHQGQELGKENGSDEMGKETREVSVENNQNTLCECMYMKNFNNNSNHFLKV